MAAIEALALGVPVVASAAGGLPGIVDESCGAICEDDKSFIAYMTGLLCDSEIYQRKSEAAHEKADSLENTQDYGATLKDIYEEVCHAE